MAPHRSEEVVSAAGSKTVLTAEDVMFKKNGRVSRLTRLEKAFLLLLFLMAVALVAVIVALTINLNKDDDDDDNEKIVVGSQQASDVCTTIECVTAAADINKNIDYSVHPCDDFYQFACGKWMEKRVIPGDRSSLTTFSELRDEVSIIVKNLLEAEISPTDSEYIKKAKTYYASCLNYDLINKLGIHPFNDFINEEFGGWPLTNSTWDGSNFDLTDMIVKLNLNSIYPLFAFYASVNSRNSSYNILKIDQPGLGMPGDKYYFVPRNDTMLMAYEKLIYDQGELFGFANPSTAKQEVKDIVDFEIRLSKIKMPFEERRDQDKLYNKMTLQEVATNYTEIVDWKRLVNTLMTTPGIDVTDVLDDEVLINRSPSYFEKLIGVLKDTPKRTLNNYIVWYAIKSLVNTQGEFIKEIYRKYDKVLFGVDTVPPRYKTCVSYASRYVGLAVGKLFIKDNFDAESKTVALDMIKDLHDSFEQLVERNDWMDEETKRVAKEKNRYIEPNIGYPKELLNETYMLEIYENLTFHRDDFMGNSLVINRDSYKFMMKNLRKPINKTKSEFLPSDVNAFYDWTRNQITFPAGILQPPFFKKSFPRSLNYGGIGVVIGHEITHGFDDRGRQYDKDGNLIQWWSEDAIKKFKSKSQCIVDQYGNYTVEKINMNLNGINTQGENIADNGGIKESYNAYRNWVKRQGKEEPRLPGVKFNHDQLFFINFAQIWCNLMRDGAAINRIRTGVHSLGRFRVIGSTQNSEDFSRVFNCPSSSNMNPKKKCSVW